MLNSLFKIASKQTSSSKSILFLFLLLTITLFVGRLLVISPVANPFLSNKEGFSLYSMLDFSNQPSKEIKVDAPPEFGVGDDYSYQKQPEGRGDRYVDEGPDGNPVPSSNYTNSSVEIWSPELIQEFLKFQATENPDVVFDMDMVQQQANEQEVRELLETGKWPWSERCKKIYADVISKSNMTKKSPLRGMEVDQTIYNERVMLQMLGLNEPEGKFLLHGKSIPNPNMLNHYVGSGQGTYGVNSGLIDEGVYTSKLQCEKGEMKLKQFLGYNKGITAGPIYKSTDISFDEIPALYDGFQFVEEPCNPCKALNFPYDTSCPFSIKKDKKVSPAWETIWGLPETPVAELPKEFPYWMN